MLERIDYIVKNQKVFLYRCYGEGTFVEVPGEILGLPVTELSDHCFADDASVRYKPWEIRTIYRAQWENPKGAFDASSVKEYPALCGEEIEEVFLPEGLEGIGDYAFYRCLRLHTVHLPSTLKRLSGQAFIACNYIRKFCFTVNQAGETPYILKDILGELSDRLELYFEDRDGRTVMGLLFTDYYEESQENTPARIISVIYHGTGYKYRQCFRGRILDFKKYDALFPLAVAQEYMPDVFELVYDRLNWPVELLEEAKRAYIEWLRKEYRELGRWIFAEHREEMVRLLGTYEYYTEELLEWFLEMASRKQHADLVSCLMEYRRIHFAKNKRKKYDFD